MLAHGENLYANPDTGRAHIFVYDDDADLIAAVERRGYVPNPRRGYSHLVYEIGDVSAPRLPDGYRLFSMADECDIDKRREIFGRSFNHEDPKDWPSRFAYEELQRAPDYHPDLDLVIAAPDGAYAACCIVWYDGPNRIGHVEPMGTHPEHRRLGLARTIMLEGIRRLRALGARRVPLDGGFDPFYEAIGFQKRRSCKAWEKGVRGQ